MSDGKTTSDEVDETQLELARRAGDAYRDALEYMIEEVAHTGDTRKAGDYVVGFAQEEAEGMYALRESGDLEWRTPDEENCHVEVAVCDADDGRFIPHLDVRVTVERDGDEVASFDPSFLWHPGLHHYGANVEVPGDGTYDLTIGVEPPAFERHDETNGDRYADPVEVTFEDVDIETGQD